MEGNDVKETESEISNDEDNEVYDGEFLNNLRSAFEGEMEYDK